MQYNLLVTLEQQIIIYEAKIKMTARTNETCQLVQKVEGIGPITAVVLAATISSSNDFKNRRHFAAFLGLVPRQHSSGGRERLLGISKHGDSYLRKLLTHVLDQLFCIHVKITDTRSHWINGLKMSAGANRTCVALANKNARIGLALLKNKKVYRPAI